MIKIENVVTPSDEQMEAIIFGMRNPMDSWDNSDSWYKDIVDQDGCNDWYFEIGEKDKGLMTKLANAGTGHRKFMRMMPVYCDITAPLYFWKEIDTYKVGTVRNSCSTMHKITEKEFTLDDFSHEHLLMDNLLNITHVCSACDDLDEQWVDGYYCINFIIDILNKYRDLYLIDKDKKYWWQIIQLLPSSYNQRATLMLNYEVLANIYHSRKNHKLDEWVEFCKWIETLPLSELITEKRTKC